MKICTENEVHISSKEIHAFYVFLLIPLLNEICAENEVHISSRQIGAF
jgi:hypothetical protein